MANEGQLWMTIGADNTQFARTAKDTNKRLNEMSQNVKAFSQGITSSFVEAAKSMAGFYTVAKAGTMFQSLIEKNDQFNKSMREVSTLSEEVANNLDSYKKQILDMTTKIPIGADEAAKALYQINSAGHTGADGMRVLEASAKAAIGGVTETVTAADTITTVLNAYKMSSAEAAAVSDKLFTAVKLGKTSMGELGASIAQVAPVAASFGVSIDQVLGAIATLTKNGTPTAQAVTQIRAAIVSLSSALGSTYFETHTLQQGMNDIRQAIPDNNKLKESLGTIEAVNAVLAMTGKNASGAAEDLKEFENSAGAAGKAYDKMNSGKGNELTKLQNNIMKEMADINNEISETITTLARKINEAFDSGDVEDYINTFKELIVVYGAYKGVAIAAAAAQTAYSKIVEASQEAAMAQLRQVIAMKEAETGAEGQTAAAKAASLTGREAEIAALQEEAAETVAALKAKAEEAAVNLKNAKSEQAMAQARLSSAQTGVAMREKELAAAIASGDALKVETAEIELQKAALEENAAARRLATANKEVDIAASTADTTAKAAETAATGADTAATVADTAATGFLTKAKIALSKAVNRVTAAMAANPFTVVAVAVVALGYAVYKLTQYFDDVRKSARGATADLDKYGRSAEDAKKSTEELNRVYAETNAGLKEAIARLRSFKGSKEEEDRLVRELNDKYGKAMGYYNSVNEWYKALTQNSSKYCAQMKNEARLRQLANQAAENEQKIHDIKYNEDGSLKQYSTEGKVIGTYRDINGQVIVQRAESAQQVASKDIKKLRQANKVIEKEMEAILKDNANIGQQIEKGGLGAAGGTPQKSNKAYWQGKVDEVDKAIADLDTKDKDFAKKKAALDKQKKAYQAQLRKFDDPDKSQSKQDKLKEQMERQKETRAELYQELLEMQSKNNEDQIALMKEGHNKRMREIDSEYDKEMNEVSKMALKWAKENKDAGLKDKDLTGSVNIKGMSYKGLTQDQQAALDDAIANAQEKMISSTQDLYNAEMQMANDYLKQYGTFQEQRYAIAKEYNEKIAAAQQAGASDIEIKTLKKQMNAALASTKAEELANGIDWTQMMSGVGSIVRSIAQETLKNIDEYKTTDEYKKLSATDKKSINELRGKVSGNLDYDAVNPFGNKIWRDLETQTQIYEASLKRLNDANKAHQQAIDDVEQAEKEYAKALSSGDRARTTEAAMKKQQAEARRESTAMEVSSAQAETAQAQTTLTDTTVKLNNGLNDVVSNFQSLTSGSLYGFAKGVTGVIHQLTGAGKEAGSTGAAIGELGGKAGGLIGAILQLIDLLGTEPAKFIDDLLSKVSNVVQAVLSQLPQIIYGIIKGAANIVGSVFQGLGGMIGLDVAAGNAKEVADATERNTKAIDANTFRLEKLKEALDKSTGTKAVSLSQAAIDTQKAINQLNADNLREQMNYHSAHHSNDYYLSRNLGNVNKSWQKEYQNAAMLSGLNMMRNITKTSDLYNLSPEEMAAVKAYMPETWKLITEAGKYDKTEWWDNVVEQAGKLEEITQQVQENITQWSFDSLKDEFRSTLMDMDADAMDFANAFTEHMMDAVLNMKLGEGENSIYKQLEDWWNGYYKKMADGTLTETERKQAQEEYSEIVQQGIDLRNGLANLTGYSSMANQKATANGIESITADQADQLVGRITAMQIAVEANKNSILGIVTQISQVASLSTQGNAYLSDILSQHAISNSYLEDIAKYSKAMSRELEGRMQKLVDNTSRL